jgi:hypothetical protein
MVRRMSHSAALMRAIYDRYAETGICSGGQRTMHGATEFYRVTLQTAVWIELGRHT